jgi:hypothetical protein
MRANILLLFGALIGIILAASGLLEDKSASAVQSESVAEVNGVYLPTDQFTTIAKGISEKKSSSLENKEYQYILQKLIDEELLVQRGQELGLLQLNSVVRNTLIQAVTTAIISENSGINISDNKLEEFYEENKNYFKPANKINVRHIKFNDKANAQNALKALRHGTSFENVKATYAENEIIKIPKGLLPLSSLRQYFGPTLTETLAGLPFQQYSSLIEHKTSGTIAWYIFYIQEKALAEAPALNDIKTVVETEYLRQLNEKTISDYIAWLRKRANIEKLSTDELKTLIQEYQ